MNLYFAYGANLNLSSMAQRCPQARPLQAIHLPNWRLGFCGHATIDPHPGDHVPGAIWNITPDCEVSLDRFEGFPVYYDKHYVEYQGLTLMFYRITVDQPSSPSAGYLDTISQGYQHWDLDTEPLWKAVQRTEDLENDLYWSNTYSTGGTTELAHSQPGLDLGHDLGHLRDMAHTHAHG